MTRHRLEQMMSNIEMLRDTEEPNLYHVYDVSDGSPADPKTPLLVGKEESNCFSE